MTKQQILLKIKDVDDYIENQFNWRKMKKLKRVELERLLNAFETLYETFSELMKD